MKPGSIGDPDLYLGGKVCPIELDTAHGQNHRLRIITHQVYVSAAIDNVEEYLAKHNNSCKFPKNHAQAPFATG